MANNPAALDGRQERRRTGARTAKGTEARSGHSFTGKGNSHGQDALGWRSGYTLARIEPDWLRVVRLRPEIIELSGPEWQYSRPGQRSFAAWHSAEHSANYSAKHTAEFATIVDDAARFFGRYHAVLWWRGTDAGRPGWQ